MTQKLYRNCIKVSTTLIFLLILQVARAQYDFSALDAKLNSYKTKLGNNVVAIIYKDGKIIYTKSLGDFTATTQAPIASCSKWLTAALVMTFVDEGKLSLDDYVSKYIPEFTSYGKGYITIRQCLSHTTGIEGEKPGLASFLKSRRFNTLEEEVNDYMSKHEIYVQPGKKFSYSSIGLNIAGRVLEIISKKPFDQLMMQRIFRPLNMRNSTFYNERAVNPSGGCQSTANDYMNFLQMILNKGMFNGKRILSEASIATMQQAHTTQDMIAYTPKTAEGFDYALGEWILEKDSSGKATCVSSPGLFGTWPLVDNCRGYACIFLVKNLLGEEKRDIYTDMKNTIDSILQTNCD